MNLFEANRLHNICRHSAYRGSDSRDCRGWKWRGHPNSLQVLYKGCQSGDFLLFVTSNYFRTQIMSVLWRHLRSLLRTDQAMAKWHSILTDPSSAALLRQEDERVPKIQTMLQELAYSEYETFPTVLADLTTQLCLTEHDQTIVSYSRAILEVFVLYSITTSDCTWILGSLVTDIERQIVLLTKIMFSLRQIPLPHTGQNCLQMAAWIDATSRRDCVRAGMIRNIVRLTKTISRNSPFAVYHPENYTHRLNAAAVRRKIKPTGYYWIAMAYCLATEQVIDDCLPKYADIIDVPI